MDNYIKLIVIRLDAFHSSKIIHEWTYAAEELEKAREDIKEYDHDGNICQIYEIKTVTQCALL